MVVSWDNPSHYAQVEPLIMHLLETAIMFILKIVKEDYLKMKEDISGLL